MKTIEGFLKHRAAALVKPLKDVLPPRFYLAGGCFGKVVNDLDIFPVGDDVLTIEAKNRVANVATTKNAETWLVYDQTVQLCRYRHASIEQLIESFDFAHIQCGVLVEIVSGEVQVTKTHVSEAFKTARVCGDSWYTGSCYPLSSLVRLSKYRRRGAIGRGSAIEATIGIVADIVERGFNNYEDFKDQLDAVDLGLVVADDLSEIELETCRRLFNLLNKQHEEQAWTE